MYRKYVFYYLVLPYSEAQRFRCRCADVLARRNAIHTPMTPMVPACSSAPAWCWAGRGRAAGTTSRRQAAGTGPGRGDATGRTPGPQGEGVQIIQGAIFEKQKNLCV